MLSDQYIEVIDLLISSGCALEIEDSHKHTAIFWASRSFGDNKKIMTKLIDAKCDIDKKDFYGRTVLNSVSFFGQFELVNILIREGCALDILDDDGNTALISTASIAHTPGHQQTIILLIRARCAIDIKNKNGLTALDLAKKNGRRSIINAIRCVQ